MHITLKNDRVIAIVDTFGGELFSLRDGGGIEYLWNGDELFWSGRSPHLFPLIGTLKDNKTLINGKYYTMNKHGFVRNSEFKVHEVTEQSVTLVLKDSLLTKEIYPFSFSLSIKHTLVENGFTTSYQIVNQDDNEMYFNIGGHVGVRCPIKQTEAFEDYEVIFDQLITASAYFPPNDNPMEQEQLSTVLNHTDSLPISYDLFENGALIIDKIPSHSLLLRNKYTHCGVSFEYEGFPVLALWTFGKKKAPYLCLEPWHGLPAMAEDSMLFKNKCYVISLNPEQEKHLQYTLRIIE
jgi:galactose mutarotase-like enzyme